MISVASSTTPGIGLNSCATPSMRTAVMAAPSIELSSTRRRPLPMVVPKPRSKRLRRELAKPLGERFGIGDQSLRFLKAFEHSCTPRVSFGYFEYNSTISCSFSWICTSSSRLGWAVSRPLSASRSTSIQLGVGACAVASRAPRMVGFSYCSSRALRSRRPGLTWNDGILTLRPLTWKWPWRTIWRACARLVPKPMR